MHPKTLKPKILFWESTIPTYGLSKILQVSSHRWNKAIKIASKSVGSFSLREKWVLYELVMAKNKSDRLHNKGCYHKGQYNLTFLCIKGLCIQKQKAHDNLCFPLRRGYLLLSCIYFHARVKVFLSIPFYFLLWQISCGEERSRHINPVEYR